MKLNFFQGNSSKEKKEKNFRKTENSINLSKYPGKWVSRFFQKKKGGITRLST